MHGIGADTGISATLQPFTPLEKEETMPEMSLFTYIMSHPLVWLGCGLFMIASLVALSGRINKRDSALLYTFVISVLIVT